MSTPHIDAVLTDSMDRSARQPARTARRFHRGPTVDGRDDGPPSIMGIASVAWTQWSAKRPLLGSTLNRERASSGWTANIQKHGGTLYVRPSRASSSAWKSLNGSPVPDRLRTIVLGRHAQRANPLTPIKGSTAGSSQPPRHRRPGIQSRSVQRHTGARAASGVATAPAWPRKLHKAEPKYFNEGVREQAGARPSHQVCYRVHS